MYTRERMVRPLKLRKGTNMNLNRIVVQPRLGFLNSQNLCMELGVSPRTVRRWTRDGRLPEPRRMGRSCYWSVEEVRTLLNNRGGAK
jgi:predicted DNA-binding transcriptional regulator AlpA